MQWSFRGGTRGNAVPIVKIPLERMGMVFPLLSYGENAWERCCIVTKLPNTVPLGHKHILLKMHFVVQKDVFLTLKYGKTRCRPALCPGPHWGSLRRSPDPLVGWGGDTRFDSRAFGASNFGVPIVVNLRNDHCLNDLERRKDRYIALFHCKPAL